MARRKQHSCSRKIWGKQAGQEQRRQEGMAPGLLLLWVAFLTWESVWEGPFSACTSGVPITGCSDLPAPGALVLELQRAKGSGL